MIINVGECLKKWPSHLLLVEPLSVTVFWESYRPALFRKKCAVPFNPAALLCVEILPTEILDLVCREICRIICNN